MKLLEEIHSKKIKFSYENLKEYYMTNNFNKYLKKI